MAVKFSQFDGTVAPSKISTTQYIVGFEGNTNIKWTIKEIADEIGGGDNIYTADGTIASTNRTVTFTGTSNLYFNLSNNSRFYINSLYVLPTGRITTPQNGGFTINSFGTSLIGGNLTLYSGTHLTGSNSSGYLTISGTANTSDINARVGIIGKSATSTTDYALRVQDSAAADMLSVRDDGVITIGKGAIIQSTSNPQNNVVIGTGAKDRSSAGNASESIAIGRLAVGNSGSVGVGAQAKCTGTTSTSIGSQSEAKNNGVSLGHQAGGPNAGASAVSLGRFAQAKATGSIAIGTNTGLTGDNSIVLNATTGVTSSTADDTFEVFMTSSTDPDFVVDGVNGMTPPSFSSNPSSPSAGNVIYNTTDNKLKFYNGTAWTDAGGGGGDTIFTTSPTSVAPTTQVIKVTDSIEFRRSTGGYNGFYFSPGGSFPNEYGIMKVGNRTFLSSYSGNEGWAFGGTNTTNSFHFNTGTTTMSDGWSMRVHGGTNANGALIVKGSGLTSSTTALALQDSGGADIFNVTDDGEVKIESNLSNYTGFRIKASNGSTGTNAMAYISDNYSGSSLQDIKPFIAKRATSGADNRNTLFLGPASSTSVGYNNAGHTVVNGPWQGGIPSFNTGAAYFAPMITSSMFIAGGGNETGLFIGSGGQDSSHYALQVRSDNAHINGSVWFQLRGDDRIVYKDGNEAANKVLTCDADGVATWQTGGGDNIYTADGTITGTTHRKITLAGTSAQPNKASLEVSGAVRQGDFKVGNGYVNNKWAWSWSMAANGFVADRHFYQANFYCNSTHETGAAASAGINYLSISAQGLEHHKVSVGVGANGTVNDRLVVKGQSTTSSHYSVRVTDANDASMFSIRNDGAITIGKGATLFDEDGNGVQDVVIGDGATTDYASTYLSAQRRVAIGYQASVGAAGSVAVGAQASAGNTNCVAIGKSASVSGLNSVAVGSSATTSSGSSIAIGTNASVSGGTGIAIGGTVATGNQNGITLGGTAGQKSLSVGVGSEAVTSAQAIGCKNTKATGTGATAMGPDMTVSGANSMGFKTAPFSSTTTTLSDTDTVAFYIDPGTSQTPNFSFEKTSTGNQASFAGQVTSGFKNSISTFSFDWDEGNVQKSTATGAQTFSASNAVAGSTYILIIGTPTVTWGSSIKWPGDSSPTLAGTTNIITLLYDGTSYYATSVLNYS